MEFNFCPKCGFKLDSEYNFCPKCGIEIPHESNAKIEKQIDDFFNALENASEEDRKEFFKLIEQDLKRKKEQK